MNKRQHMAAHQPCPCESGQPYSACCALWHDGLHSQPAQHAPTPEALMRSRYSAYALQLGDYLLATWHGSTSPGELDFPPTKWLGLEIKHAAAQGDAGVVEFVARYRDSSGRAGRLHETSRFVREGAALQERWYYIDGVMDPKP
jgi:SEC-C motif domain protein